jgi:hypothetical protein
MVELHFNNVVPALEASAFSHRETVGHSSAKVCAFK